MAGEALLCSRPFWASAQHPYSRIIVATFKHLRGLTTKCGQRSDGYEVNFLKPAQKIADHGGKYIAGGFNKIQKPVWQRADRFVILQFENMDKVKAWRDAARDAQEKIGSKYATFRSFAVEGVAQY